MAVITNFIDMEGNALECWVDNQLVSLRTRNEEDEGYTVSLDVEHIDKLIKLLNDYKEALT